MFPPSSSSSNLEIESDSDFDFDFEFQVMLGLILFRWIHLGLNFDRLLVSNLKMKIR